MPKRTLILKEGRLLCPARGEDIDFEQCLACRRLEDVDLDSRRPHVVCRLETNEFDRTARARLM